MAIETQDSFPVQGPLVDTVVAAHGAIIPEVPDALQTPLAVGALALLLGAEVGDAALKAVGNVYTRLKATVDNLTSGHDRMDMHT